MGRIRGWMAPREGGYMAPKKESEDPDKPLPPPPKGSAVSRGEAGKAKS